MSDIPVPEVTMADIIEWDNARAKAAEWKAKEAILRQRVFKGKFPSPVEGTNTVELNKGYVLKAVHVINRKVDLGNLTALAAAEGVFHKEGIDANKLIEWKPDLKTKEYRALPEAKRLIFEQALIITPGSPTMSIVLPASAKNKLA